MAWVASRLSRNQLFDLAQAVCSRLEAETGERVSIDLDRAESMLETVEQTRRAGVITDHDQIRELVVGAYYYTTDGEEEAYDRLLKKARHHQLGARSSMHSHNGKFAPVAPLSAYEGDIRAGRFS